ncbi:MAG: hypothetical protein LC115_13345 [Bacteroidia bacterium]|nr:hypothetical protein [Bacteroidia bacterium]
MKTKIFLLAIGLAMFSCKKESNIVLNPQENVNAAIDNATAEDESNKIRDLTGHLAATNGYKVSGTFVPVCATVTLDRPNKKMTVDFGTSGCVCTNWDNRTRKGKVYIQFTGNWGQAGSTYSVTTENYYVNGNQHIVHEVGTYKGLNSNSQHYWEVTADDSVKLNGTSPIVTWKSTQTRTWIAGSSTVAEYSDDKYSVKGNAYGVNRDGKNYTITTTKDVIVDLGCSPSTVKLTTGTLDIKVDNRSIILDYGNGVCDNKVSVTVNGQTFEIVIQ